MYIEGGGNMARFGNEDYAQLKVLIPKKLKTEFQKKCLDEGVNMSEKIEELIKQFLEGYNDKEKLNS